MFANERQAKILDIIKKNGAVTTAALTQMFDVSIETVRRDLLNMEKSGCISRVHGGAVNRSSFKPFLNLNQRNEEQNSQKYQLSDLACDFVSDGDVISVDSGSTANVFASALVGKFSHLTVVTHSLDVFDILNKHDDFNVILCGGHFLRSENAFYGHFVHNMLDNIHIQKSFICPSAISLEYGISDWQKNLFEVQRHLIKCADSVYILADSSKYEKKAMLKLDDVKSEYVYITDSEITTELKSLYDENNIKIYTRKGDYQK